MSTERPFACPECPHTCKRQKELDQHYLSHSGEKPFACTQCAHRTAYYQCLMEHIRRRHLTQKRYVCAVCKYVGSDPGDLTEHRRLHAERPTFACQHCAFTCHTARKVNAHLKTHSTAGARFQCPHCTVVFKTKRAHRAHVSRKHVAIVALEE